MAFINPQTMQRIFGKTAFGQEGAFDPNTPQGNRMVGQLAGLGAGMTGTNGNFAQQLGAGAQGMVQGGQQAQQAYVAQQQAQQQGQMNDLRMQQARKEMERQERFQKMMRDIMGGNAQGAGGAPVRSNGPQGGIYGQANTGQPQGAQTTPAQPQPGLMAQQNPDQPLGTLSAQFESGGRGVGTVSTGEGDAGGVSYGSHQLSSEAGTMQAFLQSPEGQPFATQFGDFEPGSPQFNQIYGEVAQGAGPQFEQAQRQFIERTHVAPVAERAQRMGFPVNNRGVQEALYSQGVQHSGRGNLEILNNAAARLGGDMSDPGRVIDAIYDARGEYASQYASPEATTERYQRERQRAKQFAGAQQVGGQAQPQQAQQPTQGGQGQGQPMQQPQQAGLAAPDPMTMQLIGMMGPERGAQALFEMRQQAAERGRPPSFDELPAAVQEVMWAAGGDEQQARQIYNQQRETAQRQDMDQRDRKISDYQALYGVSREDAVRMADDLVDTQINEATGKIIMTDTRDNSVREVTPQRSGDDSAEPEMQGPTLWDVAERGNPTGLGSGIAETANRVLGQAGVEVGGDTVAQRRYFSNALQDLIRALSMNSRFPVAEMERIRREVDLQPSVFSDEGTLKASMISLDATMQDRIDYYRWMANDPSQAEELRESFGSAATQMEWFRKRMGVPEGEQATPGQQSASSGGGLMDSAPGEQGGGQMNRGQNTPAAPSGWEDDWQYLTPEERQQVLEGN